MTQWCHNIEYIMGSKSEIVPLYSLLQEWTNKIYEPNKFGKRWIGNLVGFSKINEDEQDEKKRLQYNNYRRGLIVNYFKLIEKGENAIISFTSDTAWVPFPEVYVAILRKYAPHCHYFYYTEEIGTHYIYCNDVEHKFFKHDHVVEVNYNGTSDELIPEKYKQYFPSSGIFRSYTDEYLINAMQQICNSTITNFDILKNIFSQRQKKELVMGSFIRMYKVKYVHQIL